MPSHGSYLLPHFDHATVADAMHPGILSCDAEATLTEVTRMMSTHHVHCIVVRREAGGTQDESLGVGDRLGLRRAAGGDAPSCRGHGRDARAPAGHQGRDDGWAA